MTAQICERRRFYIAIIGNELSGRTQKNVRPDIFLSPFALRELEGEGVS